MRARTVGMGGLSLAGKRVVAGLGIALCAVLIGALPASASGAGGASASKTSWRVEAVKRPGSSALLYGVSCPARAHCTSVGTTFRNGVQSTLAEHWNGSKWTVQGTPPLTGSTAGQLVAVSCASRTSCTAVGYYTPPVIGGEHQLIEHWNGHGWNRQYPPIPRGSTESELYAVSCASATSCTAVGQYYPPSSTVPVPIPAPLAEHWNGSRWTDQTVSLPANTTAQLGGVSCPTARDCVAVGTGGVFSQNSQLMAERWNGDRWRRQTIPQPAGTSFQLTSVSCQRTERCFAVGAAYNGTAVLGSIVARADGTHWTLRKDAAPAGTDLFGVSCPSFRTCTAVGEDIPNPKGTTTGVAEYWNGTRWARQELPQPNSTTTGTELYGVSCVQARYCTAIGAWAPGGHTLADHEQ